MARPTFELRRLVPSDAAAVASLRHEMLLDTPHAFWGEPLDDPGLDEAVNRERLAPGANASFGALDQDGQLVSFASFVREERPKRRHRGSIFSVYTSPSARRRGLSEGLLRLAIDYARSLEGLRFLDLGVSAETPPAQALYEKLGFVAWGRQTSALMVDCEESDDIHMALRLDELTS